VPGDRQSRSRPWCTQSGRRQAARLDLWKHLPRSTCVPGARLGPVVLLSFLVLLLASDSVAGRSPPSPLLEPISAKRLAHCERSALLRPVCPRSVPRVRFYLSHLSVELRGLGGPVLDVFGMESGGEYPGRPRLNRPPKMAHVVVAVGDVAGLSPRAVPRGDRREALRDGILRRERKAAVSFGRVRWAGREGVLFLAPSFPTGGFLGNHLNFVWRERGMQHTLSLHAWEPLTEAAAMLRTMVERLPTLAQADRLRRLSPTRTIRLPAGPATRRTNITAPPGRNAFHAYVVVPGRADVTVRIVTASVRGLELVDSTTRFGRCGVRPPLRLCYVRIAKAAAPPGGGWTLVVTKRSERPAVVRVDLGFRSL